MALHRRFWLAIVAVALVAAAFGTWAYLPPKVVVVQATRGAAVQAVYATGTVETTVMLPIAARITARLAELNVDEGAQVHKDDILGRLEDTDLRNGLAQLRSQEAFAKSDYQRNTALVKSGMIPKQTYERSRSDWQAASAASTKASAELGFAKLVAPANGVVIHRDGEVGELIPVNQPIFWISVESPLRISAEVDEEDIARVKPGQAVLIRADAFPGRVFNGTVQAITPKGDPIARSYRVRIGLSETTPLLIGMTAETNIVIRKDEHALLLPPSAINKNSVWRLRDDKLEARAVVIGANGSEAVEILQGIDASDLIVLMPDASMHAGQKVRPLQAAQQR